MKKHLLIALCLLGAMFGTMTSCSSSKTNEPQEGAEIYAAISGDGNTLTLYFDAKREKRNGVTDWSVYSNSKSAPNWETNHVKRIVLDKTMTLAQPTSTNAWFQEFCHAEKIEHLDYLNTSQVTDMSRMFNLCYKLSAIDVSHFNTSLVRKMNYLFYQCSAMTSLDLRSFTFSKTREIYCIFSMCHNLQTIYCDEDLNKYSFDEIGNIFSNCYALVGGKGTKYDANHIDITYAHPDGSGGENGYFTGNLLEVYSTYDAGNKALTIRYGDDADSHTDVYFLDGIPSSIRQEIKTIEVDPSMIDYKITSTASWFANMSSLEKVNGLDNFNTKYLRDLSMMFAYCTGLKTLNISSFHFTKATSCDGMFMGCSALTTITSLDDYSTLTNLSSIGMFSGCTSLRGGNGTAYNTGHVDASYARPDKKDSPGYFTYVEIFAMLTDEGKTMTFYYNQEPETLEGTLSSWTEKRGTYFMSTKEKENITKVIFDASVKNARPVSLEAMFESLMELETIEHLDYLNTSEVKTMQCMFWGCNKLTEVDIRSFDLHKVTSVVSMFTNTGLKTIYCNEDFSSYPNITDDFNLFRFSTNLVGGKGTKYDEDHYKISYAHPDGGHSNPGYFTKK